MVWDRLSSLSDRLERRSHNWLKPFSTGCEETRQPLMPDAPLIERLMAFRRLLRARLALFGAISTAACAVGGVMLLVGLDWLLELPTWPRLVAGLAFVIVWTAATIHWLVRPLLRPIGLGQIAGTLEEYDWPFDGGRRGKLDDRLSSTVDFLTGNPAGSEQMRRQVVASTDHLVEHIHFTEVLSLRPILHRAAGLAILAVLAGIITAAAPEFSRIGLRRYLSPFSDLRWPRDVQIVPLTGSLQVPMGEPAHLRLRIARGLTPTLRGVVHLRDGGGRVTHLAMQREGRDHFVCTLSAVSEDLTAWFEAGDDNTRDRPIEIRVVQRPVVVQAAATIEPPDYASNAAATVLDLQAGPISAVIGSAVTVSVRLSKPLGSDAAGCPTAALDFADGQTLALHRSDAGPESSLEGTFDLNGDVEFRIRATDADGWDNAAVRFYRIVAVPDETPIVVLLEPKSLVEVTPQGSLALLVRAEDDLGLTDLSIVAQGLGADNALRTSIADRLTVVGDGERVVAMADYTWTLAPLQLEPGDGLTYHMEATDNYASSRELQFARTPDHLPSASPHIGRSVSQRIKIISPDEFQESLRSQFGLLQDRIRQAMLDQQAIRDETDAVAAQAAGGQPASGEAEAIASLSSRQAALATRIRSLSQRFEQLRDQLTLNHIDSPALTEQMSDVGQRLENVALGPATQASRQLSGAAEPPGTNRNEQLNAAANAQQQVVDELAALIRFMDQWGEFNETVAKTRNLLDRQQAERQRTIELSRATLGQQPEALPEQQRTDLRQGQRRQLQLAEETAQLIEQLRRLTERLAGKDPAGAAALDESLRAGVAADVEQHMRDAGQAIEDNRLAAAALDQRAAQVGLADMLAGLQERRDRDLAELAKRIEDACQAVGELRRQQQELLDAGVEAHQLGAEPTVFSKQADQQQQLQRNTDQLAAEMEDRAEVATAARFVQRAAAPMEQAESALRIPDGPVAQAHQSQALQLLDEAVAALEELARNAAEEAWKRSLASLRDQLQEIRDRQQALNTEASEIITLVNQGQRLSRREYRTVARLAREQGELGPPVQHLREQLGDAAVYGWVIDRVLELITQARDALEGRRLDDELGTAQRHIVEELDVLIAALDEAVHLPPADEYADGQSPGGGGAGADAAGKSPVPGVAELLVLKAMQLDINAKTAEYGPDFDPNTATEEQLRQLQHLAERQQKVRELTQAVTQRAEQGHP